MIVPRHASTPSPFILKDLMDLYSNPQHRPSTHRRGAIVFRKLIRHFGPTPVQDLTRQGILQYITNSQISTSTAAMELRILRIALNNAADRGLVPTTIAQSILPRIGVVQPHQGYRPLSPQEILQLLQSSPDWIQVPILFALHTGLRFHELANLRWEHIDWERGQLIVPRDSSRRLRHIPLMEIARMILDRLQALSPSSGIIFKTPRGQSLGQATHAIVRLSARKAGLLDIRFHCLRITFATWCTDAGLPCEHLAKILGHNLSYWSSIVPFLGKQVPKDVGVPLQQPNDFEKLAELVKQNLRGLNPIIVP